jgi:hypothetical protein
MPEIPVAWLSASHHFIFIPFYFHAILSPEYKNKKAESPCGQTVGTD